MLDVHRLAPVEAEVFIPVLKSLPMSTELLNRITSNPRQCGGRPCIRGMRITVATVVGLLASGETRERILQAYPQLEAADLDEALAYAAWRLEEREEQLAG